MTKVGYLIGRFADGASTVADPYRWHLLQPLAHLHSLVCDAFKKGVCDAADRPSDMPMRVLVHQEHQQTGCLQLGEQSGSRGGSCWRSLAPVDSSIQQRRSRDGRAAGVAGGSEGRSFGGRCRGDTSRVTATIALTPYRPPCCSRTLMFAVALFRRVRKLQAPQCFLPQTLALLVTWLLITAILLHRIHFPPYLTPTT